MVVVDGKWRTIIQFLSIKHGNRTLHNGPAWRKIVGNISYSEGRGGGGGEGGGEGRELQGQQEQPSDMLKYFHYIIQAPECHAKLLQYVLTEEQKCVSLDERN